MASIYSEVAQKGSFAQVSNYYFVGPTCRAKASAASTIRTAKSVVEDIGRKAASSSEGLVELSSRSVKNSQRDSNRLMVKKYKLALPVPKSFLRGVEGESTGLPVLRMRDWAQFFLDTNNWHILCGLRLPNKARERAILKKYWQGFETLYPTHPVFEAARQGELDLARACPIVVHGDEGRGRRRVPFLVCSFRSVLGRGLHPQREAGRSGLRDYAKLNCNYLGHSYTNRFMLAGFHKAAYTGDNAGAFDALMEWIADEASLLQTEGVEDKSLGTGRYWLVLVNIVGDWPWLVKSGGLCRSFHNISRHATFNPATSRGICHLCLAGKQHVDFEEVNSLTPRWARTMFAEEAAAEDTPFSQVWHLPRQLESLWAYDLFHTVHLGVAKHFISSYIVVLSQQERGASLEARLDALCANYLSWCEARNVRAHVMKFSKEWLNYPTTTTYPTGSWHKGEISTVLLRWLEDLHQNGNGGNVQNPTLAKAGEACVALNAMMRRLYQSEAFLPTGRAREIADLGMTFLRKYSALAYEALQRGETLWALQPKIHCLHHIVLALYEQSSRGAAQNPLMVASQQDEDFIGRPSRLSRRVTTTAKLVERVLDGYLKGAYDKFIADGYLNPPAR